MVVFKKKLGMYHWAVNTRLEGRVDFLLQKFLKIDVLLEKWMPLDLLSTPYSKSLGGISCEEVGEDATGLGTNLWSKNERVLENL